MRLFTISLATMLVAGCGDVQPDAPRSTLAAGPVAGAGGWRLDGASFQRLRDDLEWQEEATIPGRMLAAAGGARGVRIVSALDDLAGTLAITSWDDTGRTAAVVDPHPYLQPVAASIAELGDRAGFVAVTLESSAAFSQGVLLAGRDDRWEVRGALPAGGEIAFADAEHGWLAGGQEYRGLFETADGGRTWTRVELASVEGAQFGAPALVDGEPVVAATRVTGTSAVWRLLRRSGGRWAPQVDARVELGYESSGLRLPTAVVGDRVVAVVPPTGDVIAVDGTRVRVEAGALPVGASAVALDADGRAWALADGTVYEARDDRAEWTVVAH